MLSVYQIEIHDEYVTDRTSNPIRMHEHHKQPRFARDDTVTLAISVLCLPCRDIHTNLGLQPAR